MQGRVLTSRLTGGWHCTIPPKKGKIRVLSGAEVFFLGLVSKVFLGLDNGLSHFWKIIGVRVLAVVAEVGSLEAWWCF